MLFTGCVLGVCVQQDILHLLIPQGKFHFFFYHKHMQLFEPTSGREARIHHGHVTSPSQNTHTSAIPTSMVLTLGGNWGCACAHHWTTTAAECLDSIEPDKLPTKASSFSWWFTFSPCFSAPILYIYILFHDINSSNLYAVFVYMESCCG